MPTITKLGRLVTYYEEFPPLKSNDPLTTWPCEVTVSTSPKPKATKRSKVVTYRQELSPIKSHDPLIHGIIRSLEKF